MSPEREPSMKDKGFWQRAYSVTFIVVLFGVFMLQLFVSGISLDSISEKYLWKTSLIEQYREFKFSIGDRVFSNAVVGKEGWLYYTGEMSLRDYQKSDPLNISNVKKLVGILNRIDTTVKGYGGTLLVVVVPDKSTVYPQYMPDEIPVIGTTVSIDRLVERADLNGSFQLLDLRPVLIDASEASQVYYKTDTHWNCLGAYYAFNEIMSILSQDYQNLHAYSLNDFEITSFESGGSSDIAKMIGAKVKENGLTFNPKFPVEISPDMDYGSNYGFVSLRVITSSNQAAPDLVIFHDSFYDACLGYFIEPAFDRTISVSYTDVELIDMLEMIDEEKPDVVILEFAERFMDYFLWHLYE